MYYFIFLYYKNIFSIFFVVGYISKLVPSLQECILGLENDTNVSRIISLSYMTAHFILLCKGASNTAHDIEFGDGK